MIVKFYFIQNKVLLYAKMKYLFKMEILQKATKKLPYSLVIPLLGTYCPKIKTLIRKDTWTLMYIEVLFIVIFF